MEIFAISTLSPCQGLPLKGSARRQGRRLQPKGCKKSYKSEQIEQKKDIERFDKIFWLLTKQYVSLQSKSKYKQI
jgi:hypothetical protein